VKPTPNSACFVTWFPTAGFPASPLGTEAAKSSVVRLGLHNNALHIDWMFTLLVSFATRTWGSGKEEVNASH